MPPNRPSTARLIVACLSLMLACAGLGAFSACNLGMVEGVQTGKPGDSFFLPALFGGLLLGLVVALWDKLWAKFPHPLWRRFLLRSVYASALLVVAVLSFRADWTTAHNWTPINIPLRLDKKHSVAATFTAEISTTHHVQIALKRNLPFEDVNAFVKGWANPDKPQRRGPPQPEIVWTVNNVIEADKSIARKEEYSHEAAGLGIGEFQAVKGQKYTVTAQVLKPSPTA